jgi:hypothetical protein
MKWGRVLAVVLAAGTLFALPTSAAHADTSTPVSAVYASSSREICHLPQSGNAQHVLGFDVGFSTPFPEAKQVIWFFGDTFVDGNNTGVFDSGFEFRTGTIARSKDMNPNNCFNLKWKKGATGQVANMLQPQGDECLTWPHGAVDLGGTMYVYYTAVHKATCADPESLDGTVSYSRGLLKITNPMTLETARVSDLWPVGSPYLFGMPYRIGSYLYLFAEEKGAFATTFAHLARVPADATSIANPAAYEYLGDSGWTSDAAASKRLFYQATAGGPVTLAYNEYLGRFLAVYGCNFSQVCASTPVSTSTGEDALTGAWNDPIPLINCGGEVWSCYQGAQHPEFNSADDSTLIITAARHDDPHYWVTVRQVQLSATPLVFSRELVDGQRDFFAPHEQDDRRHSTSEQGGSNWTYVSWPSKTPLMWENIIRPAPTPANPNATVTCSRAWVGTETTTYANAPAAACADVPLRVPRIFPNGAEPGVTQDVARIWTAPSPGKVTINGMAWVERTCGDGTMLEILQQSGTTSRVLYTKLLKPQWTKRREVRVNLLPVTVLAGDQIVFNIARGAQTGYCDRTYFNPTMVYDQDSLLRDAISDFRDNPAQGYHGWTYEICPRNSDAIGPCAKMNKFDISTGQGTWTNLLSWPAGPSDGSLMTPAKEIPPSVSGTVISRTWTAPAAGNVHVRARARDMEAPSACTPDDGVQVAVYQGSTRVWPAGTTWQTVIDPQAPVVEFDATVNAGDQLRFLVDSGPVTTCDDTRFAPTINFTWK